MRTIEEITRDQAHLSELKAQAEMLHQKLRNTIGQPMRWPVLTGDSQVDIPRMEYFVGELRGHAIAHLQRRPVDFGGTVL
jgi:hypothetical protein